MGKIFDHEKSLMEWGGFDTFWSASRWGMWPSKLPTYWPKPSKKKSDSQGSARGHRQFCYWLVHYVCDLTQANRELKAWFPYNRYESYTIALIVAIAEKKSSAIAAIIGKNHSDHMEAWLFRDRSDDDRWDRTTLSYSLTSKIPTLLSI